MGVDAVRTVNEAGLAGIWPEAVVLLHLDPEEGLRRQDGADRIGSEDLVFHREVASTFDRLAMAEPDRFVVVDATQSVDATVDEVHKALIDRWGQS